MAIVITLTKTRSLLNSGSKFFVGSVSAVLNRSPFSSSSSSSSSSDGSDSGSGSDSDGTIITGLPPKRPKYSSKFVKNVPDTEIRKSVFISQSNDVFSNLALEDWIYRNFDFTHHHVLLLWRNAPCVVVGRHQNPFSEANVSALMANEITLARRNSGGGAVYHDMGNLNCTFFTPRERYDRKYNLTMLTRAMYREYAIMADISDRDDITVNGKKVSGTAAKLGQPNAYHHCTLLVNANKAKLTAALEKDSALIIDNATKSVPSPTKNLIDCNVKVNMDVLLQAIGYEYLRTPATVLDDGGRELLEKQRGFQLINPTEKWFPGLNVLRDQYASWTWRFGKTPRFSVVKDVQLKSAVGVHDIKVQLDVEGGLISDVSLIVPNSEPIPVVTSMKGRAYTEDNFHGIVEALKSASTQNVEHAIGL